MNSKKRIDELVANVTCERSGCPKAAHRLLSYPADTAAGDGLLASPLPRRPPDVAATQGLPAAPHAPAPAGLPATLTTPPLAVVLLDVAVPASPFTPAPAPSPATPAPLGRPDPVAPVAPPVVPPAPLPALAAIATRLGKGRRSDPLCVLPVLLPLPDTEVLDMRVPLDVAAPDPLCVRALCVLIDGEASCICSKPSNSSQGPAQPHMLVQCEGSRQQKNGCGESWRSVVTGSTVCREHASKLPQALHPSLE